MEWISVSDRLPENECVCIGYQNEQLIGYVSSDRIGDMVCGTGFLCTSDSETLTHVTHWMPLPEPPKADIKPILLE